MNDSHKVQNLQQGYTLVELLIAIVLGLVLTAAVVQSYSSTKRTYSVTEGIGRIQENARFAQHFMAQDIRKAGFSSCIGRVRNLLNGDPTPFLSNRASIAAWEYDDTDSDNQAFELSGKTLERPNSAANWSGNNAISASLPNFLTGRVAKGSDVLWLKGFRELDEAQIESHNSVDANIQTRDPHGMTSRNIMLVGNCTEASLFQVDGANGNGGRRLRLASASGSKIGNRVTPGAGPQWPRRYLTDSTLYVFEQTFYYVGLGAGDLPSLFRFTTSLPYDRITASQVASESQELVEGVETLQVLLGEDTDAPTDQFANRYVSANQVTDWNNVVSARIGLLVRSPSNAADEDQGATYELLDSISFNHQDDDPVLRYVLNSTVKPRNLGLNQDLIYDICDDIDEPDGEPDNGYDTCRS